MKRHHTFLLVILLAFFIVFLGLFIYFSTTVFGYTVYPVDYAIGREPGFNLDDDAIHFGTVTPNIHMKRILTLHTDKDAIVEIFLKNIPHIFIENHTFFLPAGTIQKLPLRLQIPLAAEEGFYEGKLIVLYRRVS